MSSSTYMESTWELIRNGWMLGAECMTNRMGERGEPCGRPKSQGLEFSFSPLK